MTKAARILVDTCVPAAVVHALRNGGHDVAWTGEWALDPGDHEILKFAWQERRIVVTLDKDFGLLAVLQGIQHAGIIRLVSVATITMPARCEDALDRHGDLLAHGGIVTIEPARLRIRDPEVRNGPDPMPG